MNIYIGPQLIETLGNVFAALQQALASPLQARAIFENLKQEVLSASKAIDGLPIAAKKAQGDLFDSFARLQSGLGAIRSRGAGGAAGPEGGGAELGQAAAKTAQAAEARAKWTDLAPKKNVAPGGKPG